MTVFLAQELDYDIRTAGRSAAAEYHTHSGSHKGASRKSGKDHVLREDELIMRDYIFHSRYEQRRSHGRPDGRDQKILAEPYEPRDHKRHVQKQYQYTGVYLGEEVVYHYRNTGKAARSYAVRVQKERHADRVNERSDKHDRKPFGKLFYVGFSFFCHILFFLPDISVYGDYSNKYIAQSQQK